MLLRPPAGAGLDVLDQVRQRHRRMQAGQDVNVVFHPVDAVKMAILVLQNTPGVAEQVRTPSRRQYRRTILRGKDNMIINLGEGGHIQRGSDLSAPMTKVREGDAGWTSTRRDFGPVRRRRTT